MRVLLQRVSRAEVRVDARVTGRIAARFVALVGFTHGHGPDQVSWMAEKIATLRLFSDQAGKMNIGLAEVRDAGLLVVSQFTLYGDASQGRRPSFVQAARPEQANSLYDQFVAALRGRGIRTETGEFGATMEVELVNDGPVTMWLER